MPEQEFGSDGQLRDVDRPLVPLAAAEKRDRPDDIFAASEPASAAQRLRAFEDEHLGPDAVRINGHVERGSGSPFHALPPEKRAQYHAIEKTASTEQKLAEAREKLAIAESEHAAAIAAADNASKFGG
jgi:hypothetical protein